MRTGKRHAYKITQPKFRWAPSDAALLKLIDDLRARIPSPPTEQSK